MVPVLAGRALDRCAPAAAAYRLGGRQHPAVPTELNARGRADVVHGRLEGLA